MPSPTPSAEQMDRDQLIALCEAGLRRESTWGNRDSASAQRQLGEALVLLRAGCEFHIHGEDQDPKSNEKTVWVTIISRGFQAFELGSGYYDEDLFYIPTRERLERVGQGDWY